MDKIVPRVLINILTLMLLPIEIVIAAEIYRCDGNVMTDRPEQYQNCINLRTKEPFTAILQVAPEADLQKEGQGPDFNEGSTEESKNERLLDVSSIKAATAVCKKKGLRGSGLGEPLDNCVREHLGFNPVSSPDPNESVEITENARSYIRMKDGTATSEDARRSLEFYKAASKVFKPLAYFKLICPPRSLEEAYLTIALRVAVDPRSYGSITRAWSEAYPCER